MNQVVTITDPATGKEHKFTVVIAEGTVSISHACGASVQMTVRHDEVFSSLNHPGKATSEHTYKYSLAEND